MPECSKKLNEECVIHPVDCPNCLNDEICQMKEDFLKHPETMKRCRFFKRK